MENSYRDENKSIFNLQVDEVSKSYLLEAAKWVKFLVIVSLISMGLLLLLFIFAGAAMTSMSSAYGGGGMGALGATGMIFMMVLVLGIYFYPIYAMLKFANLTKAGLMSVNQQQFNEGLGYFKGAMKYMGILTIIGLSLYLLMFIFGMLGAMM